jgi:hypothetical protein
MLPTPKPRAIKKALTDHENPQELSSSIRAYSLVSCPNQDGYHFLLVIKIIKKPGFLVKH